MFKLRNTSATQHLNVMLLHPRAGLDFIDLYIFKDGRLDKKSELGDLRSNAQRGIIHRNSLEMITLDPNCSYTIVSKLKSYGPYELWWSIESLNHFTLHSSLKTLTWGLLGGILLTLALHNFILYFLFREISYFIYCAYALSLLLFHYTYEGFFYQYFSNSNLEFLTISSWVWVYLTLFFLFLFPYYFFKLKGEWLGILSLFFAAYALLCTLFYLCAIFNMNLLYFTRFTTPIGLLSTLYLIIFCIIILIQKRPGSLYFSIARIVFTLCAFYDTLIVGGYLKQEPFSWVVLPFGIIIDLVFLSLALGAKLHVMQNQHKTNEALLIAQSRFIAIGQTVGNITHQWKTPIAQLASQIMYLHATFIHQKKLFVNEFEKKIPQMTQSLKYIQESIELFSNFYRNSNEKSSFNPSEEIHTIEKILETKLILHSISINILSEVNSIYAHKNALTNILMILCENSIEALSNSTKVERIINISFILKDTSLLKIIIQDNAGQINAIQFKQLFTFTSSSKKDNFGLGLSIVKTLVEKKLDGKILAFNTQQGLSFEIIIPCT